MKANKPHKGVRINITAYLPGEDITNEEVNIFIGNVKDLIAARSWRYKMDFQRDNTVHLV